MRRTHSIVSGWARAPYSNKAAGWRITLSSRRFSRFNITRVLSPPASVGVAGWYFPPFAGLARKRGAHNRTITVLCEWLLNLVLALLVLCSSFVALDGNLLMKCLASCCCCVGKFADGRTGPMGATVSLFVQQIGSVMPVTFCRIGPTYFGVHGNASHPDRVSVQDSFRSTTMTITTVRRTGRVLQLILTRRPRDHVPTILISDYKLSLQIPLYAPPRCDRDSFGGFRGRGGDRSVAKCKVRRKKKALQVVAAAAVGERENVDKSHKHMFQVILKSSLPLTARSFLAIVVDVIVLLADGTIASSFADTGRRCASGKQHNLGPPQPCLWLALVRLLRSRVVGAKNKELEEHEKVFLALDVATACRGARMVKVGKMFNDTTKSLWFFILAWQNGESSWLENLMRRPWW